MGQRMFVAVVPPDPVREDLADFLDARPGMRWIHPDQWHVTLAFLASVPEPAVDELVDCLAAAAAKRRPFSASIGGAGAFPNPARASVLWLAVEPPGRLGRDDDSPLHRLAVNTRAAANVAGAAPDGRGFTPHLTLARPRPPIEATAWLRVLDTYRGPTWQVGHVDLVASYLGQGPNRRPRYDTVATLALAGVDD